MRRLGWGAALCALCALAGFAPAAQADTGAPIVPSANPAVAGQPVTFTITVAPGTTSSVTFEVDYVAGGSTPDTQYHAVPVDASGRAVFPVTFQSTGTHTIQAWYYDGGTNPAWSPTLLETVNPPPTDATATALSINPASAMLGTDVTALATVTDVASPGAIPQGDVTFERDGASIGDSYLDAAGHASMDLGGLSVGSYSIVAIYTGQPATSTVAGWAGSTSAPARATITAVPDPTGTNLSSTQNPVRSGQALTLVAQVTDGNTASTVPHGTVAFVDNGRAIARGSVNALGFARASVRLHGQGDHLVLAEYQPAGAWQSSESEQFDVLVLQPAKVSTPRACTSRARTLPLHIVRGAHVSWVAYKVDGREMAVSHRRPAFAVKVTVSGLRAGKHAVTAVLHYLSKGRNHPVKSLTGHFHVC